jgi:uncharacterized protein (TIGR02611 family)
VNLLLSQARKIVIGVVGVSVLLLGVAGLFLPVLQGWALIFAGLAILATEFVWAQRLLRNAKQAAVSAKDKVLGRKSDEPAAPTNPCEPQ